MTWDEATPPREDDRLDAERRPGEERCRGVPGSPGYVDRGEWWVVCKGCPDCTFVYEPTETP